MILAGDVGGTKTILGLFSRRGRRLVASRQGTFPSATNPSLEAIVEAFLAEGSERVTACAIGVAGPVIGERTEVVNLSWSVDARKVARLLRLKKVHLLNDLEATAWGISALPKGGTLGLTTGLRPRPGNAALLAAGTGLGTAILFWDGRRHWPAASEGGHVGFAPRDEEEIELLRYFLRRHGRLSLDRLVSGPGLRGICDFLLESGRGAASPVIAAALAAGDPSAAIAAAGLRGEDATAERALDWLVSLYGSAAGDLALVAGAVGGVWVGGGIAPKILPRLRSGAFLRSFRSKGRLSHFLERIPVRVILEPRTGLLGAAVRAAQGVPGSLLASSMGRPR
ncbi:MAG: glucokinase [Acidobacteriia bacterium]|nr:glucokinase [Terriglobia bacterium]